MIDRKTLDCIESCNQLLKANTFFANGKNFRVGHLYNSCAASRLPHENLFGVYLAKPQFAWMALWLAVTSRAHLRKRQVNYFRPHYDCGDWVGRAGIFNPRKLPVAAVLCQQAYLYLFDPSNFRHFPRLDLSGIISAKDKEASLAHNGFRKDTMVRDDESYATFIPLFTEGMIVDIDEWQVALISAPQVIPDAEFVISTNTIRQLSERVIWQETDWCGHYIRPTAGVSSDRM